MAIDTKKYYKDHKYCVIRNFLSKEMSYFLYQYALMRARRAATFYISRYKDYRPDIDGTYEDKQAPRTYSCYADPAMETLLDKSTLKMREITGLKLIPTYSYHRLYKHGDDLKKHRDRKSCDISTTICLGYDISNLSKEEQQDYAWPIWVASETLQPHKAPLKPGDMLVYRGERLDHWRLPFDGVNNGQVFLHYNKAEDTDNLYDGRPELGLPSGFKTHNG